MTDREAILDVIARYAHAVDDRDVEAIVDLFAPGGRIEFEGGAASSDGHDGIRSAFESAFGRPQLAPPAASTHLMTSTTVAIDGDTATAATVAVALLARPDDGTLTTRGLRYDDRFQRVEGEWRIGHRRHRCTWQAVSGADVTASVQVLAAVDDEVRPGDER